MYYFDDKTKKEIFVNRDVGKWLEAFSKKLGLDALSSAKIEDKEKILKFAIENYQLGDMSIDDLSNICGKLLDSLKIEEKVKTKLGEMLTLGSDLSYYERFNRDDNKPNFVTYLNNVLDFANIED